MYDLAARYIALCEGYYNWYNFQWDGEYKFLRQVVRGTSTPIIFDVGANIGQWAKMVLKECPHAILHLFEPFPPSFELLSQNFSSLATTNCVAVGDINGTIDLLLYNNLEHSLIVNEQQICKGKITVPLITLDEYCFQKNIDQVYLLKIDVEGAEIKVLLGARTLIRECRIMVIQFEYSYKWIASRAFLRDAYTILSPQYRLFKIVPAGLWEFPKYHPSLENFRCSNFVAVNQDDKVLLERLGPSVRNWPPRVYGVGWRVGE
ncbi:MAG: FkbM family methyltransferase [Acetomicrobium sp.]|nr:FkbM family methyltransferase [Acetomicrobium sp.]